MVRLRQKTNKEHLIIGITGTSAGCAIPFGLMLIEALKGEETAQRIAGQIVIR